MRVVNWDTAHGSRRMTSRPWKTDDFLNNLLKMFLICNTSIVRVVSNSQVISDLFKANLAKVSNRVSKHVVDFSYAAHRYDSTTKPLGDGRGFVVFGRSKPTIVHIPYPKDVAPTQSPNHGL